MNILKQIIATACILIITYYTATAQAVPTTQATLAVTNAAIPTPKKALTHKDYDQWQSITEKYISNNGKLITYVVTPQEGDGTLYVSKPDATVLHTIPRGYNATITTDNSFVICKIKPPFKDTREAKIKKKKPEDLPKDSLAIIDLVKDTIIKIAKIKSYKTPEKASGYIAYLLEKQDAPKSKTSVVPDSTTQINQVLKMADSLRQVADSLVRKTQEAKLKGLSVLTPSPKKQEPKPKADEPVEEGTDLVIHNLYTLNKKIYTLTTEYYIDMYGNKILVETSKKNGDTTKKAMVLWHAFNTNKVDTICTSFNDAKSYKMDEQGTQVAFVIEKDSSAKALQKYYALLYYKLGMPTATTVLSKASSNLPKGVTVSPDFDNTFSKDGTQLYFGLAPIRQPKDTSLVDFETAKLDVWSHTDDYLQPQQLVQLQQELKRSYTTVLNTTTMQWTQVGNDSAERIQLINNGNTPYVLGSTTKGNRIAAQWQGYSLASYFLINNNTGSRTTIVRNTRANVSMSPQGKYAYWYNSTTKHWYTYNVATGATMQCTKGIKVPLYDEENDVPDEPSPHGIMQWKLGDDYLYVYDKYDIWQCDPSGIIPPMLLTNGRATTTTTRWNNTDREAQGIDLTKKYIFSEFNNTTKESNLNVLRINELKSDHSFTMPSTFRGFVQAKDSGSVYLYTAESPTKSPYLMYYQKKTDNSGNSINIIHEPNPQQANYNWYTTELITWKMLDGKISEGILYKPENFDPKKKYPIIFYFYERDADDLYNYRNPAPSASTVNIPWFTSNGYLIFDPNIYYKTGEPGQSAFNSVVSAAKHLTKKYSWVDSTKMGIQGQSWGGYQVAHLVTRTGMFAAAGAGAPVANMTSAYGGIRWGSGINRQFQYEHTQSRIGATLWQNQAAYLRNSPLFYANKVNTPLLIMHNDKDGAVPWYQGIEYFTALKRLQKKVWLLQYNDEDHNLIERRNRKDLSIRLGQFFDHYLKGAAMPPWMSKGVPATDKGINWGIE